MAYLLGYFAPMLILVILGCVFAKKALGWILYLVGVGVTLLSLIGRARQAALYAQYGIVDQSAPLMWGIFFVILVVGASVIIRRRNNGKDD